MWTRLEETESVAEHRVYRDRTEDARTSGSLKFLPNAPTAVVRYASISRHVDRPGRDGEPLDSRRDSSERLWHRLVVPPFGSPVPTEYRNSDPITRQ